MCVYLATVFLQVLIQLQHLEQTLLQELLQRGPWQRVTSDPVHLHTQLEEQRLDEPGRLQETEGQSPPGHAGRPEHTLTWTGRRILDVMLLPDSASSWISRSSQLVEVVRMALAVSARRAELNFSRSTWRTSVHTSHDHLGGAGGLWWS